MPHPPPLHCAAAPAARTFLFLLRYICGRLPAYTNLQNLTWCITSLTDKQQTSFTKSVAALFGNGLSVLTLFCDQRRPDTDSLADAACAAPKQLHDASAFAIKGIVAAAAAAKSLSEINFVRLSLSAQCVTSVIDAPAHVRRCLKFHGGLRCDAPSRARALRCVVLLQFVTIVTRGCSLQLARSNRARAAAAQAVLHRRRRVVAHHVRRALVCACVWQASLRFAARQRACTRACCSEAQPTPVMRDVAATRDATDPLYSPSTEPKFRSQGAASVPLSFGELTASGVAQPF